MRALVLAPGLGLISETFVSDLVAGLAGRLGTLDVAAGTVGEAFSAPEGVRVHQVPFMNLTRLSDRVRHQLGRVPLWSGERDTPLDRQAERALAPLLADLAPGVVHIEHGAALARAAPILGKRDLPFVAHLHGHDVSGALADPGYRDAIGVALGEADRIIVASRHMARMAALAGAPAERIRIVPHGVSVEGVEPEPWAARRRRPPSAVFLGRMTPKKHPVALIEAFRLAHAEHPEATLHMIGNGPERPRAAAWASRRLPEGAVRFHGALPRARALGIVRRQWVYAQHSVSGFDGDQEGFGLSLAEAALLHLPVVCTRHNGFPEQVVEGETGFLVPEYAYEEMGQRLAQLFADPDRCATMGAAGRARIGELYRPAARLDALVSVYREVSECGREPRNAAR